MLATPQCEQPFCSNSTDEVFPPQKTTDFRALYDNLQAYADRRDDASNDPKRIQIEVQTFQIPNLLAVLPVDCKRDSVVEIGCATGELVAGPPQNMFMTRHGYDISPLNIAAAHARYPLCRFFSTPLPEIEARYDVVVLSDILEHVEDDVALLTDAAAIAATLLINLPLERCFQKMDAAVRPPRPFRAFRMLRPIRRIKPNTKGRP